MHTLNRRVLASSPRDYAWSFSEPPRLRASVSSACRSTCLRRVAKGFGEDGLLKFVNMRFGFLIAGFELAGETEKGFDATDDFFLLISLC